MRTELASTTVISLPPPDLSNLPAADVVGPPTIVLFGCDDRGRPHASRFAGGAAAETKEAARLMGLHLAVASTTALNDLASRLPVGRLFKSGRAFVPYVKADLYERLLVATGTTKKVIPLSAAGKAAEAAVSAGKASGGRDCPTSPGGAAKSPSEWDGIGIGSTVLACQGSMEGWWEAVVLYTQADDRFVLRWRDFPDEPEISRDRTDLGLMPPGSREGLS